MIGLHGTAGDQRIGPLRQGIGNQKFEFSSFVAPPGKTQQIVTLHVNGRPAQGLRQPV